MRAQRLQHSSSNKNYVKLILCFALSCAVTACTPFIFQPSRYTYHTASELGLTVYDVFLRTRDEIQIHGWLVKAKAPAKGTVLVLHGNAQNLTAHVKTVAWMPSFGYNVFIIDYRGYGLSTGSPGIPEVFEDITTSLRWLTDNDETQRRPIFLFGQSLGAALAVSFIGTHPEAKEHIAGVILDGSFSRLRLIAREKVSSNWALWLFQYPISWLLTDRYDPQDYVSSISPLPLLIMHSRSDEVVPFHHSGMLFQAAKHPKFLLVSGGPHIHTFSDPRCREAVIGFMSQWSPSDVEVVVK